MNRRLLPITLLAVALGAIGIAGFLLPEAEPEIPKRVLFPNTAGPVVFDHFSHEKAEIKCVECHHASKVSTTEVPCGVCHPGEFDETFRREHIHWFEGKAACATCHHLEWDRPIFNHQLHEQVAESCQDCHHGEEIEPEPTSCRDCHVESADDGMPSIREAVHERCRTCHTDMFEQELAGCSNCHSRKNMRDVDMDNPTACQKCHDKPHAELVPPRKEAFHKQCMGCHQRTGKGPFRAEGDAKDCFLCHRPR